MTITDNSRRRFLRGTAASAGAVLLPHVAHSASALAYQPAVFEASVDSALLWIAGDGEASPVIELGTDETFTSARKIALGPLARSSDYLATHRIDGLEPDKLWFYRILDAQNGAAMSRVGRFRTAPSTPRPFTFAWSADMDEAYKPFRLFDQISARNPEFFLHLGDTIYADLRRNQFSPSVSHYRRKHASSRRDPHLQQFLLRHAAYAMWDDHETDNNCHAGHAHIAEGRQVFREFWPSRGPAADGLYRQFSWAGVDFYMLDTRSYRSPQTAAEGPEKTMLGPGQKQWFLDALAKSKSPFKFVITSVPFQGGGVDTWGSYRTERNEISALIRKNKIAGVVFLTGDYHLARDWTNPKAGFREFMAGPIGSFVHYLQTPSARDRYEKSGTFHYGDGYNFGLVHVNPSAGTARVEFVDKDGKTLAEVDFSA
ncbi:MAG: alkaline phosphatase D family protein [Burkholderiales bacterium]